MNDPFADIRPYNDDEVGGVLARLLADSEFMDVLGSSRFPKANRFLPWLVLPLVRFFLQRELAPVKDVASMQRVIKGYMDRMIQSTTVGFTVSGLENLSAHESYLFMSNHRDIALDPAFTNYALYTQGMNTVRIAIGDNLLTKPWVSDLMRLNKSFIVKRSVSGPRQLLAASKHLSNYIQHSIVEEHESIWLAQREGRAKNGIDITEAVIIKMLSMSRDKSAEEFAPHIARLKIVPVAISYELDPCDALKAAELYQLESQGFYKKGEQEDVASITKGISGAKGAVHVSFGSPLDASFPTPNAVAEEVDRQVIALYRLHSSNLYAHQILHGEPPQLPDELIVDQGESTRAAFEARINALPAEHRPFALATYANVVDRKLQAYRASISLVN